MDPIKIAVPVPVDRDTGLTPLISPRMRVGAAPPAMPHPMVPAMQHIQMHPDIAAAQAAQSQMAAGSGGPRRTEVPAMRLRKVIEFIQRSGRRPTRKSTDPTEKSLGIWLHRFTCNDDGVKDRAQGSLSPEEFTTMVRMIEQAPDAKQVSDRQIALANIEAIAERASLLNALPLRGDPSGCGRKLHNIRQGRLGPGMRDEALAIVRRVIGNAPEKANVLQHLEASIEQSVARHTEAAASNTLSRGKAKRGFERGSPVCSLAPL